MRIVREQAAREEEKRENVFWIICGIVFLITLVWLYSLNTRRINHEMTLHTDDPVSRMEE